MCFFLIISAFSIYAYTYVSAHRSAPHFTYAIDPLFSAHSSSAFQETIPSLIATHGPHYTLTHISDFYPAVASARCIYKPGNHAHITLHAHEPNLTVNNTKALIQDGVLIDYEFYNSEVLNTCASMHIRQLPETNKIPHAMYSIISAIPSSLHALYSFEWHSDHALILYEKTRDDVFFVCNTNSVPDPTLLAACHQVAQECRVTPSRKQRLIVDARFTDQIIVYGDTGGYGHGSRIG